MDHRTFLWQDPVTVPAGLTSSGGPIVVTNTDSFVPKSDPQLPSSIYLECHVTIDPILEQTLLEQGTGIVSKWKFKMAKLLMVEGDEQVTSTKDTFMTSHAIPANYPDLVQRMQGVCEDLRKAGFAVRRYKIESVVLDSRYEGRVFEVR